MGESIKSQATCTLQWQCDRADPNKALFKYKGVRFEDIQGEKKTIPVSWAISLPIKGIFSAQISNASRSFSPGTSRTKFLAARICSSVNALWILTIVSLEKSDPATLDT